MSSPRNLSGLGCSLRERIRDEMQCTKAAGVDGNFSCLDVVVVSGMALAGI